MPMMAFSFVVMKVYWIVLKAFTGLIDTQPPVGDMGKRPLTNNSEIIPAF